MRALVGKDFQDKVLLKVTSKMKEDNAKQQGSSTANLRLACAALGGNLQVQHHEEDEDEDEMGDDNEETTEPIGAANIVPRRVAERGTKLTRKHNIPVVKRVDGAIAPRPKRGSRLPGSGQRITSGKPKKLVSF
jgi:hypothetical protein